MTGLSPVVRRIPAIVYGMAAIFFVWSLANQWFAMASYGAVADPSLEGLYAQQKSAALYTASLEAVWLVVYGAILQVAIAIYDKMKGPAE